MEVSSLQDYINTIEKLKRNYTYSAPLCHMSMSMSVPRICKPKFIYRGQSNSEKYKVLPAAFRSFFRPDGKEVKEYSQVECDRLNDFISEACRFVTGVQPNDFQTWLELAQHFGVPTRLLDFTSNPLVALYFACSGSESAQASVWIINEPVYNKIFFGENSVVSPVQSQKKIEKIISDEIINQDSCEHSGSEFIQYPWIYKPYYREERMETQASFFMIWGARKDALTNFMNPSYYMSDADTIDHPDKGVIGEIVIHGDEKRKLLAQLDLCGINEKFIYPGLDGVGRYIKQKYSNKSNSRKGC